MISEAEFQAQEAEFQAQVIQLARLLGWRVAHFRAAQTKRGWRTPVSADGAGFPDLVLARKGRVIFAELKTQRGKLSTAQECWQNELSGLPNDDRVLVTVWRPADWSDIEAALK